MPRPDHGLSPYCSTSENGPFLYKSKSSCSPHLAATPRVFAFPSSLSPSFSPPSLSTRRSCVCWGLCCLKATPDVEKRECNFPFRTRAAFCRVGGVRERESRCVGSSRTPLTSARRRHVLSTLSRVKCKGLSGVGPEKRPSKVGPASRQPEAGVALFHRDTCAVLRLARACSFKLCHVSLD